MLAAWSGGEADTTTSTAPPAPTTTVVVGGETPLDAVVAWLDAIAIGRYPAADVVVVEDQFVLLLAVESYSVALYDGLVSGGISPEVSRTFWESFAAGVRGFTGSDITEVDVLGETRFEAYGRSFAEVEAISPRGDLTVVAVLGEDGRWYVDLLATFGQSFAPLFNLWVDRLPPDSSPVAALAGQQSSLRVARDRVSGAAADEAEAELDTLLSRLGA